MNAILKNIFDSLDSHQESWQSDLVGKCNKTTIRVRTMKDMETHFHGHMESDEAFIVLNRELQVFFDEGSISLKKGV